VIIARNGSTLLSGSVDGMLRQWDAASGRQVQVLQKPQSILQQDAFALSRSAPFALALSPAGDHLAAARAGFLKIWNLRAGKLQRARHLPMVSVLAFTPDGEALAVGTSPPGWMASPNTRAAAQAAVRALGAAAGNPAVATSGNVFNQPGRVTLYDRDVRHPKVGFHLWQESGDSACSGRLPGVTALAHSPDGMQVAIGNTRGIVQLFDAAPPPGRRTVWDKLLDRYSMNPIRASLACGGAPRAIAYVLGGSHLAIALEDRLQLWEAQASRQIGEVPVPHGVRAFAASPHGSLMATGADGGGVELWDVRSGAFRGGLTGRGSPVMALCFSQGGDTLAGGAEAGEVLVWRFR
jgi:WD40 repeat protein